MIFNIYIIVSIFFIISMFLFASFLWIKNDKKPQTIALSQLVLAILVWMILDLSTSIVFKDYRINLIIWRLGFIGALVVSIFSLRFILIFTKKKINKLFKASMFSFLLLTSYLILFTDKLILKVNVLNFSGESNFQEGSLFSLISFIILLPLLVALVYSFFKYLKEKIFEKKVILKYLFLGLFISLFLSSITNILLPAINIKVPKLANLSVFVSMIFWLYAIYRWKFLGLSMKRFKIKTKIILGVLILTIVPLVLITSILYSNIKGYLLETALNEEKHDVMMKENAINVFLEDMEAEVLFLSKMYSLHDFINSDDVDQKNYSKKMMASDFLAFSEERKVYYQIRYIDENGQEIVRVDNKGQESYIIPDNELQNKKGRYYFEDAIKAKQGVVFISPLDLNIEDGGLENRGVDDKSVYVPVIRYATPVFDDNGDSKGIIINNIYADNFLNTLNEVYLGRTLGKEIYLINKEGYFLYHPDSSKEWGFMLDNDDENIYKYCDEAGRFFEEDAGQFYSPKTDCFLSFARIYPSGTESLSRSSSNEAYGSSITKVQGEDYFWVIVSRVEGVAIFKNINSTLNNIVLIVLVNILIVLALAFILGKTIVAPINKLRKGIRIITEGDLDHKVGTNTEDEMGELSRAFDVMTDTIKKSRANINKRVNLQTKDIKQKSIELEQQQAAVLNILEDVEDEKYKTGVLAKDLEKFKLAVDNTSDHIVITDKDGKVLYANKAVERITGYTIKEVMGEKAGIKKLWGGNMGEEFYQKLWKTVKDDKKVFSGDISNTRKDGEDYDAVASISPILDDKREVRFIVGVERDVTKERQIDRAKSEFVSLASHQLRTPLSTIGWYAEMLLDEDAGSLNDEQKEYVTEVYKGNQRMVDLVNALLNVSRIELGTLAVDPKPTNLIDQANSVLNEIKPLLSKKKLKVIKNFAKAIPEINLDDKLMRIVWQNLLSNALKYTPEKGQISVGISKDKKDVKIEVADTGMGIPKAQQKNIFTKLFRADNVREKETDGTGLGLYIVKSVITQFGGKVWFKSVENKGTTFYVTIPLKGVKIKEGTRGLEYTK